MAYHTTVLGHANVVGYWRLGESSGTTAADETTTLPLTYSGSPTFGTTSLLDDTSNTAVTFDGVDDYASASIGLWPSLYAANAAIALLTIPSTIPANGTDSPLVSFTCDPGTGVVDLFEVGYYSNGTNVFAYIKYLFDFGGTVYTYGVLGNTALDLGVRNHLVFVADYNGTGEYRIYLNGVAETLSLYPGSFGNVAYLWGNITSPERMSIGGRVHDTPIYTDAIIDEVSIYAAAISAADITSLYSEVSPASGPSNIDAEIPLQSYTFSPLAITHNIPGADYNASIPTYEYTLTTSVINSTLSGVSVDSTIPLYTFSLSTSVIETNDTMFVDEGLSVGYLFTQSTTLPIIEGLTANSFVSASYLASILEDLSILDTSGTIQNMFMSLEDVVSFSDTVRQILTEIASENITLADSVEEYDELVAKIYERLDIIDSSLSSGEFSLALVAALIISERIDDISVLLIHESLTASSNALAAFLYTEALVETYIVSSLASSSKITLVIAEEDLSLLFGISGVGSIYVESIGEGIRFYLSRGDEIGYEAFVMNPENYALSRYDNFNFMDSCQFKDQYLFSNDSGIFLLDGVYDHPFTHITSVIKTASLDFGTSNKKQVPKVYIGASNSGKLILKVSVDGRSVSYFQMNLETENLDTQLIDVGKGLIGRYFQFELSTKENSEFDVDEVEFFPIMFGRKVR